jgi:hypothetical protein
MPHARSTLDATAWLITYHPERLKDWLDKHDPGLEQAAIEHIESERTRRARYKPEK